MFEFIESSVFEKHRDDYFSDDEFADFQYYISLNPEIGDLIPGSGGCRKLRWGAEGRGKRGGVRVIYYLRLRQGHIWLLTLYAKNEVATIRPEVLRAIKDRMVES